MSDPFRVYEPSECGADGYPLAWHRLDHETLLDWSSSIGESHYPPGAVMGVKHLVRAEAGHRCVRCLHPFVCGVTPGEWSPCDELCTHAGPFRWKTGMNGTGWFYVDAERENGHWPPGSMIQTTRLSVATYATGAVEAKYRILTVHHLRLGHDAKRDLRWWNLAALCQRCHLQIQGKVQMERIWPYEHSEWFKPYAAGWYAWSYLGEELTRPEVMARLDELLALELAVGTRPGAAGLTNDEPATGGRS